MTTVVDVTDHGVRVVSAGRVAVPRELEEAALEWIDDPVGLLDERPVAVADLWRSLMSTLTGERGDPVLLLHPPEWPAHRVARVVAAANTVADHVEAVPRDRWQGFGPEADVALRGCEDELHRRRPRTTAALIAGGAIVAVAGMALTVHSPTSFGEASGKTVVEGRMTVRVPADWVVARVTGGPGSRRVAVSSPTDPGIVLHLTSSYAPELTLRMAAESLTTAMAAESPGVFVDLHPRAHVGGRSAVTYREIRPGRVIAWSVVVAGATRISIGCQSPPGREAAVRGACEQAVRSARET